MCQARAFERGQRHQHRQPGDAQRQPGAVRDAVDEFFPAHLVCQRASLLFGNRA